MAQRTLVAENIEAGRQLLQHLDATGFAVRAALWLFDPQAEVYDLVLASPLYEASGPKAAITALRTEFEKLVPPLSGVSLDDVRVVPPSEQRIQSLARLFRTPPDALANIRATNNMIGNYVVEDALIYRMSP